jgi:ribosome-associated protein YbcJ (S4-like RNA binding protein)
MTNYSFATSLEPYHEAPHLKRKQSEDILAFISKGANCLLQLAQLTGLPQSTVSGRCNDLVSEGKAKYNGFVIYENRKRKKIVVIKKVPEGRQSELNFFVS